MNRKESKKHAMVDRTRGFTLLEVLLSLLILSISISSLSYLAYVGIKASTRCRLQSTSLWHAQSLLDEAIVGCSSLEFSSAKPVPCDADWHYRIIRRPSRTESVSHYQVEVWKPGRWSDASRVTLERLAFHKENLE